MTYMAQHYNPKKNQEGYDDPTTYTAMKNVDNDPEKKEVVGLLKVLNKIASYAGFYIENRIVLRNIKTGKTWR